MALRLESLASDIRRLDSRISAIERVNQQGILQFGDIILDGFTGLITAGANEEITIDGNNKRAVFKDSSGVNRILIDADNGVIKVSQSGTNVLTATDSQLTFLSTYRQLRESTIHTSGGNTFANVAPYVDISDFLTKVDFTDWDDMEWYVEATFKAGTGTASVRLYNNTDAAAVSGSVLQTTSTSYVSVRSSSMTKPTGTKTFVVQYGHTPSGGGSDFINLTIVRHIFRRPA